MKQKVKKYLVMDNSMGQSVHDYTVEIHTESDRTDYKLFRSEATHWADDVRGRLSMTVVDNGDDITIIHDGHMHEDNYACTTIQYDNAAELYILLSVMNRQRSPLYNGEIIQHTIKKHKL